MSSDFGLERYLELLRAWVEAIPACGYLVEFGFCGPEAKTVAGQVTLREKRHVKVHFEEKWPEHVSLVLFLRESSSNMEKEAVLDAATLWSEAKLSESDLRISMQSFSIFGSLDPRRHLSKVAEFFTNFANRGWLGNLGHVREGEHDIPFRIWPDDPDLPIEEQFASRSDLSLNSFELLFRRPKDFDLGTESSALNEQYNSGGTFRHFGSTSSEWVREVKVGPEPLGRELFYLSGRDSDYECLGSLRTLETLKVARVESTLMLRSFSKEVVFLSPFAVAGDQVPKPLQCHEPRTVFPIPRSAAYQHPISACLSFMAR